MGERLITVIYQNDVMYWPEEFVVELQKKIDNLDHHLSRANQSLWQETEYRNNAVIKQMNAEGQLRVAKQRIEELEEEIEHLKDERAM